MRRPVAAALLSLLVAALLSACGTPHLTPPPPSKVDVATPDMVAMKAKSDIADCPAGPLPSGSGVLPKITIKCLGGGRSVDLSTLKGPVVLNFWQAGCIPCRKEMPALQQFYQQYGDQVPVIGVDTTDVLPGVALKDAIKRGITYPLVADPGGDLQDTKLRIQGPPTFWLLGADGRLVSHAGGFSTPAEIKKLVDDELGLSL